MGMWIALLAASALTSAAPEKSSMLVLGFDARQGVSEETASVMTDQLVTHLTNARRFSSVTSRAQLSIALGIEREKQLIDCDKASCFAEIANALGADLVVHGRVARVGSVYAVSLTLFEARTSTIRASASRTLPGDDDGQLVLVIPQLADELLASLDGARAEKPPVQRKARIPDEEDDAESHARLRTLALFPMLGALGMHALVVTGIVLGHGLLAAAFTVAHALSLPLQNPVELLGGVTAFAVLSVTALLAVAAGIAHIVVAALMASAFRGHLAGAARAVAIGWLAFAGVTTVLALVTLPAWILVGLGANLVLSATYGNSDGRVRESQRPYPGDPMAIVAFVSLMGGLTALGILVVGVPSLGFAAVSTLLGVLEG